LVQEADIACFLGVCDRHVVQNIQAIVQAAGLPDRLPQWTSAKIWNAMLHDKKVSGGKVVGVWPERIGQVRMMPIDEPTFHQWHKTLHKTTSGKRLSRKKTVKERR
jgi:3-dehydroquinate synthase